MYLLVVSYTLILEILATYVNVLYVIKLRALRLDILEPGQEARGSAMYTFAHEGVESKSESQQDGKTKTQR